MPNHSNKKPCDDVDLDHIYNLLLDLKKTLDTHITEENLYKPKVIELVEILDRSKGVAWFVKRLIAASVGLWAFIYWVRDHIRL